MRAGHAEPFVLTVTSLAPGILILAPALLFALWLAARLWTSRIVRRLEVTRMLDHRAFAGETVAVTLTVRNRSYLPVPFLELQEQVPAELQLQHLPGHVLTLRHKGSERIDYTLHCRQRGLYAIGPWEGRTGDVLGLRERRVEGSTAESLLVYPRIVPLETLGLPTRSDLAVLPTRSRLVEDPSRLIGVRDYQPGDPPRRIHWPATARLDTLSVKQYQTGTTRETLLCLDLDPSAYHVMWRESIEQAIVVAASLANHIVTREDLPVGLALVGRDQPAAEPQPVMISPAGGRKQLIRILETLALVRPVTNSSFPTLLRHQAGRLRWGATVIAVSGSPSPILINTLAAVVRRGHPAALIVVQPMHTDRSGATRLRGISRYQVWSDETLRMLA